MKLYDTLPPNEKITMLNGTAVGIFPKMILPNDTFYSKINDICLGYYTSRSGEKTLSPTYEKIIDMVSKTDAITNSAEDIIGNLIRSKFIEKWERVYKVLLATQYDALNDYERVENKNGSLDNTKTYNNTRQRSGNDFDETVYDVHNNDTTNISEKEVTTNSDTNSDSIYGFNSLNSVPTDKSDIEANETRIRDPEDNQTIKSSDKSGTERINHGINNSESLTGTDTDNDEYSESRDVKGRDTNASYLIDKELNMRNKHLFYDIIYADIDSIAVLQIYI